MSREQDDGLLTFGGHLDVLRAMLIRVLAVTAVFAAVIFAFKEATFGIILAPGRSDFVTYRMIEKLLRHVIPGFAFEPFDVELIATDLASQFMTHITTSIYLGLLYASPFILYELFRFVSPALLDSERRYSVQTVTVIYLLFVAGVLMSYFVLFPISFRFLGTYSVAAEVRSTITLDSYISTFVTLTLLMGVVFQLPVIAFVLARMGLLQASLLRDCRRGAILVICIAAAVITPPDVMTLVLVAVPLYLLYEVSIRVAERVEKRSD